MPCCDGSTRRCRVGALTSAFSETLGEEAAKSTKRAFGRTRRRTRRLEITIPDSATFLVLIWPDGFTDESVLALLDFDIPIEGGAFCWNPDTHSWERNEQN